MCSAAMGALLGGMREVCLFSECTIIEDEGNEDILSNHNTGEENLFSHRTEPKYSSCALLG